MKKCIRLSDIEINRKIDKNIFNHKGTLLLPKGTLLTKEYADKLKMLGIEEVYIEDAEPAEKPKKRSEKQDDKSEGEIEQNIGGDLVTGGICRGNLNVAGSLNGRIHVISDGDVKISGNVIDGSITCKSGGIYIGGGINGNGNSEIFAKGTIKTSFAKRCRVVSEKDINVLQYVEDSDIKCKGDLVIKSDGSSFVSKTKINCSGNILVDNLGNGEDSRVMIKIEDVEKMEMQRELDEIDNILRDRINTIRRMQKLIDMLMVMGEKVKKLDDATQKKIAMQTKTYLQYNNEIEEKKQRSRFLADKLKAINNKRRYFITVLNKVFPGVEIVIDNAKIVVREETEKVAFYKKGIIVMQKLENVSM